MNFQTVGNVYNRKGRSYLEIILYVNKTWLFLQMILSNQR